MGQTLFPDVQGIKLFALVVSLPLALIAYYVVEAPFRRASKLDLRVAFKFGLLASTTAAAAFIWWGHHAHLAVPDRAKAVQLAQNDRTFITGCTLGLKDTDFRPCLATSGGAKNTLMLFGDSYAGHFVGGILAAAKERKWDVVVRTRASCPPILAFAYSSELNAPYTQCMTWRKSVLEEIKRTRPNLVIVSSYTGAATSLYDEETLEKFDRSRSREAWRTGFRDLIKEIAAPA